MSHGIPRTSAIEPQSAESKQAQRKKIDSYLTLVSQVNDKVIHEQPYSESLTDRTKAKNQQHDQEALDLTSKLLTENPEYYTIWNHRRRILVTQTGLLKCAGSEDSEETVKQVSGIFVKDLKFLVPLLQKFPKCYWLWNHRSWLLKQAEQQLPVDVAIKFWTEELGLIGKMLGRDGRNFHAWGYRREVVSRLERLDRQKGGSGSMAQKEFEYTRNMIGKDLSNFSAWHARSNLLLRIAREREAGAAERKKMLEEELELIHEALIDPKDQSLWYYHQFLRTTFEPNPSDHCIAPALSTEERLRYIQGEVDYVLEMVDDGEDIKWIYVALVELAALYVRQSGGRWPDGADAQKAKAWLEHVNDLDPLRKDRWTDLSKILG